MSAGLLVEEYDTEYTVSPFKRLGTSTGLIAEQAADRLRCCSHCLTTVSWRAKCANTQAFCCSCYTQAT